MYNFGKHTGKENDIEWCVDDSLVETIVISVKSNKTNESATTTYKCIHKPIFGYDCEDVQRVEKILDFIIDELRGNENRGKRL